MMSTSRDIPDFSGCYKKEQCLGDMSVDVYMCICTLIGASLNQEGICVRWGMKVRVPRGANLSASTVLRGSVSQQVNLIAEERR